MSTLGNKLRDARIEKGYTLNTLQQTTKIQKKYLVAIEEGNFQELPGNFYIRAFIKQYADVVGLNGDELLETYASEIEYGTQEEVSSIENIETEELGSRVKARQVSIEKDTTETLLSYLPLAFLIGVILMIIIALITAITRLNNNSSQVENTSITSTALVSTVEPEQAEISQSDVTVSQTTDTLLDNQIRVGNKVLTLVSEEGEETVYEIDSSESFEGYEFGVLGVSYVWVGMLEDEVMVVDTTITENEQLDYTVNEGVESFRIRLGYPEGGTFTVNGQPLEFENPYFPGTIVFRLKSTTPSTTVDDEIVTTVEEEVNE